MTMSPKPAATSCSTCHAISGLPPTASSALGSLVGQRPHAFAAAGREDHGFHRGPGIQRSVNYDSRRCGGTQRGQNV